MRICNKLTGELFPELNKFTGTKILEYLSKKDPYIKDIVFNLSTSKGKIDHANKCPLVFENCDFNYIDFYDLKDIIFKKCSFNMCNLYYLQQVIFEDCDYNYNSNVNKLSGNITFNNVIKFGDLQNIIESNANIKSINSPDLDRVLSRQAELYKETVKFIKDNKYGYKLVEVPVLVKLSFPEDSMIVNLEKEKCRASKAFVEDLIPITNCKNGITNYSYVPTDYIKGQIVYPDQFDRSHIECGKGISFCKSISDLINYLGVSSDIVDRLEEMDQILTNNVINGTFENI